MPHAVMLQRMGILQRVLQLTINIPVVVKLGFWVVALTELEDHRLYVRHTQRCSVGAHHASAARPLAYYQSYPLRIGRIGTVAVGVVFRDLQRLLLHQVALRDLQHELIVRRRVGTHIVYIAYHLYAYRERVDHHLRHLGRVAALGLRLRHGRHGAVVQLQAEMHLPIRCKVRILGILLLRLGQRRQVVLTHHLGRLRKLMIPSPYRGGCTAHTVVDTSAGILHFFAAEPYLILCVWLTGRILAHHFARHVHALLRLIHLRCVGTQRQQRIILHVVVSRVTSVRHGLYRLCVREVSLRGTLHLKHIALYQVLRTRITDLPTQFHVARHGLLLVQHLLSAQVIHAVISRDMYLVGFQRLRVAAIIHLDGERSREETLYRILGWHDDRTRALAEQHLLTIERGMVAHRLLIHRKLHPGAAVTRCAGRVHGVEIGLEQLRRLRGLVAAELIGLGPPVLVAALAARLLIYIRTHAPVEIRILQARGRVPVKHEVSDALVVIVLLALERHLALPTRPVGIVAGLQHDRLAVVRTLDDGASLVDIDISLTLTAVLVVLAIAYGRYRGNTMHAAATAARVRTRRVPDIRVFRTTKVVPTLQVVVVRTTIHPDRHIESQHTITHTHHGVMSLLLQVVIRLHTRCCCQ